MGRLVENCPSQECHEDSLHRLFSLLFQLRDRPHSTQLAFTLLRKYVRCLLRVDALRYTELHLSPTNICPNLWNLGFLTPCG